MKKVVKELVILALLTTLSALLVWLPFGAFGKAQGMLSVFANYDGPNYIIIAKTLYNPDKIKAAFSMPLPVEYYPAHLPAYPLLVKFFDSFMPGTWAMLAVTLLTTILAVWAFYLLVFKFRLSKSPFWLCFVFLFLPARFLAVRSVGSPEPLFIFAIFSSIYFFKSALVPKKDNILSPFKNVTFDFFLAGIFGALAQVTKTPGILLFIAYIAYLVYRYTKTKKFPIQAWPLLLIPFSILPVFWFYKVQTGNFLAYFYSGDNFHLVFPPFQSFNMERSWLGDFWLEDMIYIYLLGALAVLFLFKKKLHILACFALTFFTVTLFIAHRDLSRYSLPLAPLALIAFSDFIEKKEFRIAFALIVVASYLYAINFIAHNTAPVQDWTPYL